MSSKPVQAAILCGGKGERLRPLTDTIPKPLAVVNGKPFLWYLLDQLKSSGVSEVVLITGYRGEQIKEYCGNGMEWGLTICYSHGPEEWDTGRRLFEARSLLRDEFLLLYGDNFAQLNLDALRQSHRDQNKKITLSLCEKKNGNIRIDTDGAVLVYDKTRKQPDLNFVEIGYMYVCKDVLTYLSSDIDVSFSEVIRLAVADTHVHGVVSHDGYYSISDLDRLAVTERYLKEKKILLIDRDGTINKKAPRGEYIANWDSFECIPETVAGLQELSKNGYTFIVISNQAGIGRGVLKRKSVDDIHAKMIQWMAEKQIQILDVFLCPHHWDDNCFCRKPNPGLFHQASRAHLLRLDKTVYIGDDARDCQAAYNAGCKSIFIGNPTEVATLAPHEQPVAVYNTLQAAVPFITQMNG